MTFSLLFLIFSLTLK